MNDDLIKALGEFIKKHEGYALAEMKSKLYDAAIISARYNESKAARMLGVNRSTINLHVKNKGDK